MGLPFSSFIRKFPLNIEDQPDYRSMFFLGNSVFCRAVHAQAASALSIVRPCPGSTSACGSCCFELFRFFGMDSGMPDARLSKSR